MSVLETERATLTPRARVHGPTVADAASTAQPSEDVAPPAASLVGRVASRRDPSAAPRLLALPVAT
jgi:hypothetical protein